MVPDGNVLPFEERSPIDTRCDPDSARPERHIPPAVYRVFRPEGGSIRYAGRRGLTGSESKTFVAYRILGCAWRTSRCRAILLN